MTTLKSAAGPAQIAIERRGTNFEGAPIVGQAKLSTRDFSDMWVALPQNRHLFLRIGLWLAVIPLLWLISALLNARSGPTHVTWEVALPPIAVVVGLTIAVWRDRNLAKSAIVPLRGAEGVEFRFDAAGFFCRAAGKPLQHAWSALHGYVETATAFAIYFAPRVVEVVPKRAFAESEQVRLRAHLLALVPNRSLTATQVWRPTKRTVLLALVLVLASLAIWQVVESP
jgi:hypothetical protein